MRPRTADPFDESIDSPVSPLIDLVFNMMITMFVFVMIYMLISRPVTLLPPQFLRWDLPSTADHFPYRTNIAVGGGSGQFTYLFVDGDETRPITDVAGPGPMDVNDDRVREGWDHLRVDGLGLLRLAVGSGILEAYLAVPGERRGEMERGDAAARPQVTFEVVVIDRKRPGDAGRERWGAVDLCFENEDASRPTDAAGDQASGEPANGLPEGPPCYWSMRSDFSIDIEPLSIAFDPADRPLALGLADIDLRQTAGFPMAVSLAPVGGIEPYEFTFLDPLPPGLSFDPATGVLSGTPTDPGLTALRVAVKDGQTPPDDWRTAEETRGAAGTPYAEAVVTLDIRPFVPLQATIAMPAYARLGDTVDGAVSARGGYGERRFIAQELPPGLSLDPVSGAITGTVRDLGAFPIVIVVEDENPDPAQAGITVRHPGRWRVIAPLPAPGPVELRTVPEAPDPG